MRCLPAHRNGLLGWSTDLAAFWLYDGGNTINFEGKTVLVTGATSGIGEATAKWFGTLGAQVLISGRDRTRAEQVLAAIEHAGDTLALSPPISTIPTPCCASPMTPVRVDVLINNAGGSPFGGTAETRADVLQGILDLNLIAPFLLTGQLAPKMGERGHGAIVNVSSHAAGHGIPFLGAYGAAKAGIDLLTKAWAVEFGPLGVRTNAVSPGGVRTPPALAMGEMFEQMAKANPLGRAATPEEVASTIVYLASEDASYINGAIVKSTPAWAPAEPEQTQSR